MELKNITPFDKFRKIIEARGVSSEFSNEVGFAKSLVGRALFSIIRYFKQGVDIGRLQYMKNKLENEYFAGFLRLLVMKGIDLKEPVYEGSKPVVPSQTEQPQPTETPTNEESPVICGILHLDYNKKNALENKRNDFGSWKEELEESKPDYTGDELLEIESTINEFELFLAVIALKMQINDVFEDLYKYQVNEGANFDEATTTSILASLDKILNFLKDEKLKHCPRYKLTPENMGGENRGVEQLIIKRLATCNPETIKNKCNEILTLIGLITPPAQAQTQAQTGTTAESLFYDDSDLILEKIGSGIKIMQLLGDSLNTSAETGQTSNIVTTKKYLANIGISTVDQINFKALAQIFHQHPELRNEVAQMVSLDGVRNIQYYVARIIYRIKKTPTYTGITPETGGGVDYKEDSALRTYWEKLVERVKGEWTYFINLEDYKLDPFAALNLQEAMRTNTSAGNTFVKKVTTITNIGQEIVLAEKAGLKVHEGEYSTEKTPVVLQLRDPSGNLSYIVCSLHNTTTTPVYKVYRYLGNIDLHKIINENVHNDADFKSTKAKQYATSIYDADHDTKACSPNLKSYFKIDFTRRLKGPIEYYINGIYFASSNFQKYSTVGFPTTQNSHCLSLYVKTGGGGIANTGNFRKLINKPTADEQILIMSNNAEVPDIKDLKGSHLFSLQVGQLFTFEDTTWAEAYFPNFSTQITTGAQSPPAITEADWKGVINFKK